MHKWQVSFNNVNNNLITMFWHLRTRVLMLNRLSAFLELFALRSRRSGKSSL